MSEIIFVPDKNKTHYKYAISACLCGVCCRYDGKTKCIPEIKALYDSGEAILICPEVMGGMPTPRKPSEIRGEKVVTSDGDDNTDFFLKGASKALSLCKKYNVKIAILKQNSPSCGSKQVYDGSFSGKLVDGAGVTAKLISSSGIEIKDEKVTEF